MIIALMRLHYRAATLSDSVIYDSVKLAAHGQTNHMNLNLKNQSLDPNKHGLSNITQFIPVTPRWFQQYTCLFSIVFPYTVYSFYKRCGPFP